MIWYHSLRQVRRRDGTEVKRADQVRVRRQNLRQTVVRGVAVEMQEKVKERRTGLREMTKKKRVLVEVNTSRFTLAHRSRSLHSVNPSLHPGTPLEFDAASQNPRWVYRFYRRSDPKWVNAAKIIFLHTRGRRHGVYPLLQRTSTPTRCNTHTRHGAALFI